LITLQISGELEGEKMRAVITKNDLCQF